MVIPTIPSHHERPSASRAAHGGQGTNGLDSGFASTLRLDVPT
ncbi:hypothetical protein ATKI12_0745 [Kitasatospora sp. Ki12]